MDSNFIVGAQVVAATSSDASTLEDSHHGAQNHLNNAGLSDAIEEVTAYMGYHSTAILTSLAEHTNYRTYIREPKQPKGRKRNLRDPTEAERRTIKSNRRRARGSKGRSLQRQRSEKVERSFAHTLETEGGRRTRLRGLEKNQMRYLPLTAAYNLGLMLSTLFGTGTARSLRGIKGGRKIALFLVFESDSSRHSASISLWRTALFGIGLEGLMSQKSPSSTGY